MQYQKDLEYFLPHTPQPNWALSSKEKISCGVGRTEEISHQRRMGWCEIRTCMAGGAKFALAWAAVRNSHLLDAVVYRRPYLPHFSSKSYTVWSVGFLTSWALKWYIACRKWTSGSTPKVRRNTIAVVLYFLHFVFLFASLLYLACLNDPKSCQNTKTSHKYD